MSKVQIPDAGGSALHLHELRGKLYPAFPPEYLENVFDFEARPDDILLCTYPKSGTHWAFEIIRLLLSGTFGGPVVEKDGSMIEDAPKANLDKMASPRNLNTHYAFEDLSPEFFRQKSKMIYITRDPRDVAVSFYNHHTKLKGFYNYDGKWTNYFPLYMEGKVDYGSWFDYTKGWEKGMKDHPDHPFLVLAYEAMKQNPLQEVRRISAFIGAECSEEMLQSVVDHSSIDSMKKKRGAVQGDFADVMYRKGITGDWKNYFTVAQSEMLNEKFEKEMAGTDAYKLYSHSPRVTSHRHQPADANKNSG